MTQLAARELVNIGWLIVCICLAIIFAAFLVKEMSEDGWYIKLRNRAAISLFVYFIGETLARGWGAMLLNRMSHGMTVQGAFDIEQKYPLALAGAAISFVGALCCVRVFSPSSWGNRAWVFVALIAILAMVITYLS